MEGPDGSTMQVCEDNFNANFNGNINGNFNGNFNGIGEVEDYLYCDNEDISAKFQWLC